MEPINEALELLKRRAELESGLRQPGGIRITEERELYALRDRLQRYPQAVTAILQTARNLNRPVETLQATDVRRLGGAGLRKRGRWGQIHVPLAFSYHHSVKHRFW